MLTNVAQQPFGEIPPTRSPTRWVVTPVRPRDHAGEIGSGSRKPALEAGVAAEGDQHVGEVDARRSDRDLDFPGSRWDAGERGQLDRVSPQAYGSATAFRRCSGCTTAVRRSSGLSGVKESRAMYH